MGHMKRFLLASALALAMAGAAHAADMPLNAMPVPVYNWTGWYIGANAGGAWNNNQNAPFSGTGTFAAFNFGNNEFPSSVPLSSKGGFGGLQTGYNWQLSPMWLVGVETDIQLAHIEGTTEVTPIPFAAAGLLPFTTQVTTESDWFGTLRARLGWLATQTLLIYGTGGLAYGETSTRFSTTNVTALCTGGITCTLGSSSSNRAGWAAGGGLEWMFAPHWTLRAEFLHVDLGSQSVTAAPFTPTGAATISSFTTSSTFHENIVRAAVNFGFGP
jgi:outer membrane immunogenic protein